MSHQIFQRTQHRARASSRPAVFRIARPLGVGVGVSECSRACLIRCIDFPELPLRANVRDTLKCGRSSLVVRAEIPFGDRLLPIAYKRFRRRNVWKVVTGAFKPSRAFRAWKLGHALRAHGIATPRPLFAIVPRALTRTIDSYLATDWIDGFSLNEVTHLVCGLSASERFRGLRTVAATVGSLLGRLHRAGFSHRDLKPSNVMVAGELMEPSTLEALLVDLDGVSRPLRLSRRTKIRNLSRLWIGFGLESAPRVTCSVQFVQAYLAESGDAHWNWKACWRQLIEATANRERKRRRKRRAA